MDTPPIPNPEDSPPDPAAAPEQPAPDGGPAGDATPRAAEERAPSSRDGAHPAGDGAHPAGNGAHPISNGSRPIHDGAHPFGNGGRPFSNGDRPFSNGGHPIASGIRPNANGGRPIINGIHPIVNGGRPIANGVGHFCRGFWQFLRFLAGKGEFHGRSSPSLRGFPGIPATAAPIFLPTAGFPHAVFQMPPWDEGFWDSGQTWDSDPISPPNPQPKPKKKHNTMKLQNYYPSRIGDQIVWLRNVRTKLPIYATLLQLDAAEAAAFLLDVDNAIYALETYRGAIATFSDAAYRRVEDALNNEALTGSIAWLTLAVPAGAPAAVAYGCLARIFTYINETIKKAAAYDEAIAAELGTEAPEQAGPDPMEAPEFTLRAAAGGKLEVVWPKGGFDGVKLQFDLGAAGTREDVDLRPNYTLNWLPAAGTSAIIKVRLMYILKGEDTGTWSDWESWTLTGA